MKTNRVKPPPHLMKEDVKILLEEGVLGGVFPSAAAGISRGLGKEKKEVYAHCGSAALFPVKRKLKKQSFFDLASLTKPLATAMAILCLLQEKKIDINEKLPSLLNKNITGKKGKIKAKDLLCHTSGLPAYREYFHILKKVPPEKRKERAESLILSEPLAYEPGTAAIYSDLGFMLLGLIIEKKAGSPLEKYVAEKVLSPLNLERKILYNPLLARKMDIKKMDFAATEKCPWRQKILCGEVHDDNCYALGGVSGHSGLFGTIEGVTILAGIILDMWKGAAEHPHIKRGDLVHFLARQETVKGSSWALGFDTPAAEESSGGSFLSQKSVGHLGFTGTSFWIDPEKDIAMVLLSNRVHPSRENNKIKKFRPYFHDRVMEKMFPPTR